MFGGHESSSHGHAKQGIKRLAEQKIRYSPLELAAWMTKPLG